MKRLLSAISVLCILFLFVQREDDSELCWGYYLTEMLDGMGLVNTTEHFATYVVGDDGVIIETAGKEYLYADIEYTSNYMSSPTWKEADFDRDGIEISAEVKHLGNGNWQLSDVCCRGGKTVADQFSQCFFPR